MPLEVYEFAVADTDTPNLPHWLDGHTYCEPISLLVDLPPGRVKLLAALVKLVENWHRVPAFLGQLVPQHAGRPLAAATHSDRPRGRANQIQRDVEGLARDSLDKLL